MPEYICLLEDNTTSQKVYKVSISNDPYIKNPPRCTQLFQIQCDNPTIYKKNINTEFKKKYKQSRESDNYCFEGNPNEMIKDIFNTIIDSISKDNDIYVTQMIDLAILHQDPYEIDKAAYSILAPEYKTKNNKWYYYDKETDEWMETYEGASLRNQLSEKVSSKFVERSHYYKQKYIETNNQNDKQLYAQMYNRALQIVLKLKDTVHKENLMLNMYHLLSN